MINHRLLFSIAVLTMGMLIVGISVVRNTRPHSLINSGSQDEVALNQLLNKESTGSSTIYSSLPNPGILPDSPIYWVKMVRDRVDLITTSDHTEKAKLMILYSNKRLHSGTLLIQKGDTSLGVSTISKAEKYLEKANTYIKEVEDGNTTELFKSTLIIHQKVLKDLIDNSNVENKSVLVKMHELNNSILSQHMAEIPKPLNQQLPVSAEASDSAQSEQ